MAPNSRRLAQWLFPAAVSLHNLEEAVWLPAFWRHRGWKLVGATQFRVSALVIALLAFIITYASVRSSRSSVGAHLFVAFCLVMFLNALWHIAATIYLRTYAPGVVTAVLVVLPTTGYLLAPVFRDRIILSLAERKGRT